MDHKNQPYNTVAGMTPLCGNLEDFHSLLDARRAACYDEHGEKYAALTTYIVLGKWILDEYGQVGTLVDVRDERDYTVITKEMMPEIPTVISVEDYRELIANHLKPKVAMQFGFGGRPTPQSIPVGSRCKICGEPLTLLESDKILFGEKEDFSVNDAVAVLGDLSRFSVDELEKALAEHHHSLVRVYMKNGADRTIDNFDFYLVSSLAHEKCHGTMLGADVRKKFASALTEAGIGNYGSVRIKNEYGSESYNGPWFVFDTSIGNLRLGWRKRVINIDYSEIDADYVAKTELTVGPGFEHVNNYHGLSDALERFTIHLAEKPSK